MPNSQTCDLLVVTATSNPTIRTTPTTEGILTKGSGTGPSGGVYGKVRWLPPRMDGTNPQKMEHLLSKQT